MKITETLGAFNPLQTFFHNEDHHVHIFKADQTSESTLDNYKRPSVMCSETLP